MIRHCVFLRFKSTITDEEKTALYDELAGIKSILSGILAIDFSKNVSPEPHSKGYEDGFIVDFDNAASRDAYLENKEHQAVGAKLVSMLEGELAGLLVYDLEI